MGVSTQQEQLQPFAWVSDVLSNSPAEAAGLKLGDAVLLFGELGKRNTQDSDNPIQDVSKLVGEREGKLVEVKIERKNFVGEREVIDLKFTP